jgi:hypothetical protein
VLKQDREAVVKTHVQKNATIFHFPYDDMEMALKLNVNSFEKFTKGGFFPGDQTKWLNAREAAVAAARRAVAAASAMATYCAETPFALEVMVFTILSTLFLICVFFYRITSYYACQMGRTMRC